MKESKYIIYKTTNLKNNYIYIGVHKTETPYEFDGYLGNGVWIKKPYTYEYSKTKFQQAIKEFGIKNFKRETLQVYDTAEEAYYVESILVDKEFLKRPDVYNMVLGGEMQQYKAVTTYQFSVDGKLLQTYETIKDAAEKMNIRPSTLCQAILYCRSCCGYYWASTQQIDITKYNIPIKTHKVYIYNLDGSFYKEFETCNQAAKEIGVAGVERAARLGYCLNKKYYASFLKSDSYSIANTEYIKLRPVYKYDSEGKFICGYEHQKDAEKENKYSNICKSIKGKSLDKNGFYWSLEKLEKYNVSTKNKKKKVGMFDENGTLLKVFDSGRQCSLEYGRGVYHCLKGEYDKHKGYVFKYIN